jgi:5-bromo-4-chloroindolyl phosphate hydrolysis protein
MTFAEILATVALNDEIIITINGEDVDRVKTGLKNVKAKQAAKMKEEGLVPDSSTLAFIVSKPINDEGDVDLKIILNQKSTVRIKKIVVPDGEF